MSAVILALPVKEMEVSARVPPDALVMKYPEETVTVMVAISTIWVATSLETSNPSPVVVTLHDSVCSLLIAIDLCVISPLR